MADDYFVQVRMNGGPFQIDADHKSVLRKKDLQGAGRIFLEATD